MNRRETLRNKILKLMIPMIIIFIGINTYMNYSQNKRVIERNFTNEVSMAMKNSINNIQLKFEKFRYTTEGIAINIQNNLNILTTYDLENSLKGIITKDDNVQGMGIWFDPITNSKNRSYTTFVYKENGVPVISEEYNKIDYTKESWYQLGKSLEGHVKWTGVYKDGVTGDYVVTVVVPILDKNSKFVGVVTSDILVDNIISTVNEIKIGKTGEAFLIDKDGYYLANNNIEKVLNNINISQDQEAGLKDISKNILLNTWGKEKFRDSEGQKELFYEEIPDLNWKIGITINDDELISMLKVEVMRTVAMASIIILGMIIVILYITKYIVGNIDKVNRLSQKLAEGDFTSNLEIETNDEIGVMSHNLNFMIENLRDIIVTIQNKIQDNLGESQELASISEESEINSNNINESIKRVIGGSQTQNVLINQSTRSVTEIKDGVEEINTNIQEINNMSEKVKNYVKIGRSDLNESTKVMNDIDEMVKSFAEQFRELNNKSDKIDDIIKLISGISEKTNLLALNAAIEAARAGEHGKGFAVVADEIRGLAEQSQKSSINVISLINDIKEQITSLSSGVKETLEGTQKGTEKISDTNSSYDSISDLIEDLSKRIYEISLVMEELSVLSSDISDSMNRIEDISNSSLKENKNIEEDIKNLTQGIATVSMAAENLSQNAEEMENAIIKFRLE